MLLHLSPGMLVSNVMATGVIEDIQSFSPRELVGTR